MPIVSIITLSYNRAGYLKTTIKPVQNQTSQDWDRFFGLSQDLKKQAELLLFLAENPKLRKSMGDAGRKKVGEHFSPQNEKNSLLNILQMAA